MRLRRLASTDDEFEKLRQAQETRNEILINYVQLVHFTLVLVANIATHIFPVVDYRASPALLALLGASLFLRLILWRYLRSRPPYLYARKYVLSTVDLAVFTALPLLLGWQEAFSWLFLCPFAVCIYSLLVVLSGLRYDAKVVAYNYFATILLYVAIFPWTVTPTFRLPMLVVGILTLSCIALCTAYGSVSLMRMFREASIKEQLARFLSPELIDQLAKEPDLLRRKTERRNATVVFADIRGFTRMSEQLTPERVVEFLNQFLDEMTVAIMQHQGMIDKYIGDAVMGVFGVPLQSDDHALRALRAAIEMRDRVVQLNVQLSQQGLPPLSVGIGLHTGDLLIGAIGSSRRLDYTVIGDTVNVASRIEGMTRSYPVEILLSEATREAIGGRIDVHLVATAHVRNREQPIELWSPDPLPDGVRAEQNDAAEKAMV